MKIELVKVKIKDLVDRFHIDNSTGAVSGFGGKLNIQPKYQRDFIYGDKEQKEVIRTVRKGFPLNIMYWSKNPDGTFELLDGQQRTRSICRYMTETFSVDGYTFSNLTPEEIKRVEDYEIMVYICEGEEREKLDWFEIVNIAGKPLTPQELRNSVYTGDWLTDAKKYFSGKDPAVNRYGRGKYMKRSGDRQEILEDVLGWISGGKIEEYMSHHQKDTNARDLIKYFEMVIDWVESVFLEYDKEMIGLPWGELYNEHKDDGFEKIAEENTRRAQELREDYEVQNKSGIYRYILTDEEKWLNLRQFNKSEAKTKYAQQKGICPICLKHFEFEEMEADHINPWSKGGKTEVSNLQMLCRKCNHEKSNRY